MFLRDGEFKCTCASRIFCNTILSAGFHMVDGFSVVGEPDIQRAVICMELSILITRLNSTATEKQPDLK